MRNLTPILILLAFAAVIWFLVSGNEEVDEKGQAPTFTIEVDAKFYDQWRELRDKEKE